MVRDWFFPHHAKVDAYSAPPKDMRQRAVDMVNLWLFKEGLIPPAVSATANLTEALLHDTVPGRRGGISDLAMQSIYAMAFVRFVNAFVDRDVAKSFTVTLAAEESADTAGTSSVRTEKSMYAHAAMIGMPEEFVHLRHQVTHGEMPSLLHLKKMTLQALEWLWEKWWKTNAQGDPARALREAEVMKYLSREATEARRQRKIIPTDEQVSPREEVAQKSNKG